jgi:hypothetical protein
MTEDEAREYVQRWKQAGPALEKVHRDELKGFVFGAHAIQIDSLIAAGLLHSSPSTTSGMVEMQRILAKARSRNTTRDR